jgi:hypothetical protein
MCCVENGKPWYRTGKVGTVEQFEKMVVGAEGKAATERNIGWMGSMSQPDGIVAKPRQKEEVQQAWVLVQQWLQRKKACPSKVPKNRGGKAFASMVEHWGRGGGVSARM